MTLHILHNEVADKFSDKWSQSEGILKEREKDGKIERESEVNKKVNS